MPLSLCQYTGTGTRADPFRPAGVDLLNDWHSLDLRPDPTQQAGVCLVWHDTDTPVGALRTLGATKDDQLGAALRTFIANRLGITLTMTKLGDIIGEILLKRGLVPTGGRSQVWCGLTTPWFDVPVIAGGAVIATDNFNRANADPLDGSWTNLSGSLSKKFKLASNAATPEAVGNDNISYNTGTFPNDQYAQAKVTVSGTGSETGIGVAVRVTGTANSNASLYWLVACHAASNNVTLAKFVSGTYTVIWQRTQSFTDGDTFYLEAQGSTLVAKLNGSAIGTSSTDTSVTSGNAGIAYSSTTTSASLDDFEGGDFTGGGTTVTPGVASLTTSGKAPTVTASDNKSVTPGNAALTTSGKAPTVSVSDNKSVTPSVASLGLTGYAPTVSVSDNKTVTPDTLALITSLLAPTVTATANQTATPAAASLVTSGKAPTVTATGNQTVTPGTASLSTAGYAPTVTATANQTATPGTASLVTSTFAPTVTAGGNQSVTPGTASLTTAGQAPTVSVSDNKSVTPDAATLALTAFAPTVTATDNISVSPAAAALVVTLLAPTVTATANQTVTPGTLALVLTAYAVTVSTSAPATSNLIDVNGSYAPIIGITGSYTPTINASGSYVPTIDVTGRSS